MNRELLLQHFDRISEAPDAIPRLRRFILDLAVRGKLVEQSPSDEPAAELLKRIQAEKVKRIKSGEIRSPRSLEWSETVEPLFVVPNSWGWVRLVDVGAIIGGGTPSSGDADNLTTGGTEIAWLTPADLGKHKGLYVSHGARDLTDKGLKASSATLMPKGTVLFTSRAPIGYTAIAANVITTNQGFKSVVPYNVDCSRYIALYLQAFAPWIDSKASGTTFREVSGKIVSGLPFPLPPLAEQHRIVAKADELMALCDQLQAARNEREARRDRLVASSLQQLQNQPAEPNPPPLRGRVREGGKVLSATMSPISPSPTPQPPPVKGGGVNGLFLDHLPRLTTRTEHIKQLRQTILNLAVRGRLVPQDPNDEPAAELLKRIRAEKARLVKEGKIKKEKPLPPIEDEDKTFEISKGWEWVRLQDAYDVRDGTHDTPKYVEENGVPLITSRNFVNGRICFDNAKLISLIDHNSIKKRSGVDKGDILYSMIGGNIGNQVMVDCDIKFSIKNLALFKSYTKKETFSKYLNLFLQTVTIGLQNRAVGGAQPFVSLGLLRNICIPLPPLAEQHRIVAKVDELMTLCDQLEAQLCSTEADSRHLLEAVLRDALNPEMKVTVPAVSSLVLALSLHSLDGRGLRGG